MTATVIHLGDVGTVFELTIVENDGATAVDVSSATVKKIYFMDAAGTKKSATAVFTTDGSDGKIRYTSVAGFINSTGMWSMQGYVEIGTAKYYSEKTSFKVNSVIS